MPFDSPPPPDPDNLPWLDVLHLRPLNPEHCYHSESRWSRERDKPGSKSNDERPSDRDQRDLTSA